MSFPQKITFVIASLQGGGAERVVCAMANYWAEKEHDVTITTLASDDVSASYSLLPTVSIENLDVLGKTGNAFSDNIERIKKIRMAFKSQKPDVIISFMESTNVLSLLAAAGLEIPVIISDRIDPQSYNYGRIWRCLRGVTYPFAASFVVQTKAVLKSYPSYLSRKASVIPNFVDIDFQSEHKRKNAICAMGRLNKQKGFDVLLRAFSKVTKQFPDWSLEIWGEGNERDSLEKLKQELGLSESVSFPGFSESAIDEIKNAGVFVLSSRYEGFPNALMEAMACGLPVISTRCPYGPEELITDSENGLLVPVDDEEALAKAIVYFLDDKSLRKKTGQNAAIKIQENYNIEHIMKQWEELMLCS